MGTTSRVTRHVLVELFERGVSHRYGDMITPEKVHSSRLRRRFHRSRLEVEIEGLGKIRNHTYYTSTELVMSTDSSLNHYLNVRVGWSCLLLVGNDMTVPTYILRKFVTVRCEHVNTNGGSHD